jgi:hypothetical protein
MRLWTLHPRHLDAAGLVALWREALLAQAVLRGRTRGYRRHPQLDRFRAAGRPLAAIATYLDAVRAEADRRGYEFDASRVGRARTSERIVATSGQLLHERAHLARKLRRRAPAAGRELAKAARVRPHPLFRVVPGPVEPWERG